MPKGKGNPKSEFLQIRVTKQDRIHIDRAAAKEFLDTSTWARKVILEAVARMETQSSQNAKKS